MDHDDLSVADFALRPDQLYPDVVWRSGIALSDLFSRKDAKTQRGISGSNCNGNGEIKLIFLRLFLKEITHQLKEHAAQHDLENRAVECCEHYLRNLLARAPEETRFYLRGLSIEELVFEFQKHQLVFGYHRSWPHILAQVNFGCREEESVDVFGWYYLETLEEGEISDDWFWWEQMRDEEGKLTKFSRVLE